MPLKSLHNCFIKQKRQNTDTDNAFAIGMWLVIAVCDDDLLEEIPRASQRRRLLPLLRLVVKAQCRLNVELVIPPVHDKVNLMLTYQVLECQGQTPQSLPIHSPSPPRVRNPAPRGNGSLENAPQEHSSAWICNPDDVGKHL